VTQKISRISKKARSFSLKAHFEEGYENELPKKTQISGNKMVCISVLNLIVWRSICTSTSDVNNKA